jgi:cyanophycinase
MELTKAHGRLIAIGGAEDHDGEARILKKFVELAKGNDAHIIVMTVATDHPQKSGDELKKVFNRLGAKKVDALDVSEREDAESEKNIKLIERATGLYFTGGDQIHITSLLGGTRLQKIIHERYEKDLIVAGTSAGAAMMGNSMILNGGSEESPRLRGVEIGPGMDLIIGAIIDTHFDQRGRHGRLLAAVAHYPQDLGLGVDENTAMIINKDEFEVIGDGAVTVIDGGGMTYTNAPDVRQGSNLALADVRVHILPEGYKFNLHERCVVVPNKLKSKAKKAGNENGKNK